MADEIIQINGKKIKYNSDPFFNYLIPLRNGTGPFKSVGPFPCNMGKFLESISRDYNSNNKKFINLVIGECDAFLNLSEETQRGVPLVGNLSLPTTDFDIPDLGPSSKPSLKPNAIMEHIKETKALLEQLL